MSGPLPVSLSDVFAARRRIGRHLHRTVLVPSAWLAGIGGAPVALKVETLQVTGSFKVRGALNALMRLKEARGAGTTLVTASAGNHGRAVAWAAERLGLRAVVFTPRDAPRAKTDAIRRHGADLRTEAPTYEDAERLAQAWAARTGDPYVSPYDHPDVIAGAGTIAIELMEDDPDLDLVLVPLGGGGLLSGIAAAMHGLKPEAAVVGVEAAASTAFSAARAAGHIVTIEVGATVADGISGNVDPRTMTWPFIRDLVRDVVSVPERSIRAAIRDLVANERLVAEGAGAVAVGAITAGRVALEGRRTAVVLSGANIDLSALEPLIRG